MNFKLNLKQFSPKKSLSQHFLIDSNIIRKVCEIAKISREDKVLEIGTGLGALTEELLEKGAYVYGIEKDKELVQKLMNAFKFQEKFQIFWADALKFSLENLPESLKLVSNLPFHITGPALLRFAPLFPKISSMTLIVQKEIGQKILIGKRSRSNGFFPLFLNCYCEPKFCFPISPHSFFPKPSVTSWVMYFRLHPFCFSFSEKSFFIFLRKAFSQKRKMIRSSLKSCYSIAVLEKAIRAAKISIDSRPEELSLEEFAILFEALIEESNQRDTKQTRNDDVFPRK